MFIRLAAFFLVFLTTQVAFASCDFAEQAEKSGKLDIALMQYIYCAEEENDPEAQYKLGTMFYQGKGVRRPDYRRAVVYFSRSANNGYAPAQAKLGLLYWRGEGITKNMKMAHKWLYLAQEDASSRWFYYTGATSDKSAKSLYQKLDSILRTDEREMTAAVPFASSIPVSSYAPDLLLSYKEVAEFQHEKLMKAGEDFLDDRGQKDLGLYLDSLLPDIKPQLPPTLSDSEKSIVLQTILNWFKPVLLNAKNLDTKKAPVLEKLKTAVDAYDAAQK